MDYEKTESFLRAHWPAALMATVIVVPVVWMIADKFYSERIVILNNTIQARDDQIKVLQEYADRSRVKLAASTSSFTLSDLFTPSVGVQLEED